MTSEVDCCENFFMAKNNEHEHCMKKLLLKEIAEDPTSIITDHDKCEYTMEMFKQFYTKSSSINEDTDEDKYTKIFNIIIKKRVLLLMLVEFLAKILNYTCG